MNTRVELDHGRGKYYLVDLFPIKWTEFISSAKNFGSPEEARSMLNTRLYQLSEILTQDMISAIEIVTLENGVEINRERYIGR